MRERGRARARVGIMHTCWHTRTSCQKREEFPSAHTHAPIHTHTHTLFQLCPPRTARSVPNRYPPPRRALSTHPATTYARTHARAVTALTLMAKFRAYFKRTENVAKFNRLIFGVKLCQYRCTHTPTSTHPHTHFWYAETCRSFCAYARERRFCVLGNAQN